MKKTVAYSPDGRQIVMAEMSLDGIAQLAGFRMPWDEQEMEPLVSYDSPPGNMTAEQYREFLFEGARLAPDLVEFARALFQAIGPELVKQHVPLVVAAQAVADFARKVWGDARSDAE